MQMNDDDDDDEGIGEANAGVDVERMHAKYGATLYTRFYVHLSANKYLFDI